MSVGRRVGATALASVAALTVAAAPAAATSIQDLSGRPYTGELDGVLTGNAVFSSTVGNVTCNQSPLTGEITDSGSLGTPAAGTIDAIDWTNNGNQACPDTIDFGFVNPSHQNFLALGLPWSIRADWLSDNTTGTRNGTLTFSGFRFTADFDVIDCSYRGDFQNTGGTTNQIQGDLHNPDNTASGNTELRFVNEPLELSPATANCPTSITFSATYSLTGLGPVISVAAPRQTPPVIKLQIREAPPPDQPLFTSANPASGSNENNPRIIGTASAGSTVRLYTDGDCLGPIAAVGTAAQFASPGLQVTVPDNSSTTFSGTAQDAHGTSECSFSRITYSEVTPPPITVITPVILVTPPAPGFDLGAAIKKCKKKFPKGPRRKRCIKKAKARAGA
jgi:hypothetical protein